MSLTSGPRALQCLLGERLFYILGEKEELAQIFQPAENQGGEMVITNYTQLPAHLPGAQRLSVSGLRCCGGSEVEGLRVFVEPFAIHRSHNYRSVAGSPVCSEECMNV